MSKRKTTVAVTEEESTVKEPLVVDATNKVAGRVASIVAKQLLQGEHVIVINAVSAVLSGNRASLILEFKERLKIRTRSAPWKGPLHWREPHYILRRMIRGMLPWKSPRGRQALKRLRVYQGAPEDITITRRLDIPKFTRTGRRTIYLSEIAREMGWKGKI